MIKKTTLFLVLFVFFFSANAQEKQIIKGNEKYSNYAFSPAIDIFNRVLEKGFVSADLLGKLGNSYYFNADYKEASAMYKRLINEFEADVKAEDYFRYAQTLRTLGNYDAADAIMDKFHALKSDSGTSVMTMKDIRRNSGKFDISEFGHNSIHNEFAPSFYRRGLLFSSDRDTGNLAKYRHTWNNRDFLDLYKVNVDSISIDNVVKLGDNINTRLHESTSVVTKDGSTMYFTRNNYRDGKFAKDDKGVIKLKIFMATLVNNEWTNEVELPFNSDSYSVAHPALSKDEKILYFSSDMPGTFGESDLFKVTINEDGTYGTPKNLGSHLNTSSRETFPFVSGEDVLYFSSDGHLGLGGLDVYATRISNDTYMSKIVNLGKPVNSDMDDFTFVFDIENRLGYFASNRDGGTGEDDIYSANEIEPLNLECEQVITGTVRDKITNKILVGTTIKVIDENNREISSSIMDSSGTYKIIINCDQGNFVRAVVEGYVPSEKYLEISEGEPQVIDFYLERDKVSAGFGDDLAKLLQLSTIYFDLDKHNIRPDAEIEIQKVIVAMEKFPSLKIKVNSHTDSQGRDSYNMALSERRAKSTVEYMIFNGISSDRLVSQGFGETKLVNECKNRVRCSKKEHQLNRRSEFIILE